MSYFNPLFNQFFRNWPYESGHLTLMDEQPKVVAGVTPLDEGKPRVVPEIELLEKVIPKEQK